MTKQQNIVLIISLLLSPFIHSVQIPSTWFLIPLAILRTVGMITYHYACREADVIAIIFNVGDP